MRKIKEIYFRCFFCGDESKDRDDIELCEKGHRDFNRCSRRAPRKGKGSLRKKK